MRKGYERNGIYSIQDVYDSVYKCRNDKVVFHGEKIKTYSQRYELFFTKGTKCCCCGIEGRYFAMERSKGQETYHLNLYAIDKNGKEILMTKDHIIPVSKGGNNSLLNYQTMCCICNEKKADKY